MKTLQFLRRLAPLCLLAPLPLLAQALPALTSTPAGAGGTQYSLSIQTLLLLTSLSFLPAMVLMMTCFTRIIIVMSLLRHAMASRHGHPDIAAQPGDGRPVAVSHFFHHVTGG